MNKKEYISKILVQLEPIWNLAKWLRILVGQWNLDGDILDTLIDAVQWAVNTAKTEVARQKLQKWLDAMEKMREMEVESRLQDERDLVELDRMLESI